MKYPKWHRKSRFWIPGFQSSQIINLFLKFHADKERYLVKFTASSFLNWLTLVVQNFIHIFHLLREEFFQHRSLYLKSRREVSIFNSKWFWMKMNRFSLGRDNDCWSKAIVKYAKITPWVEVLISRNQMDTLFTCSKDFKSAFFAFDVISLRMCCFASCVKTTEKCVQLKIVSKK